MKATKKSVLLCALSLVLCFAMLVGTTYAWFTDSVTSTGNKIQAGTLDIQLKMWNGTDYVDIGETGAPIFGAGSIAQNNNSETLWEPGKTQVAYLQLVNNGNLALKYTVEIMVYNDAKDLYKVMKYEIVPDAEPGDVTAWDSAAGTSVVVGGQRTTAIDVPMLPGAVHKFALAIHMDELAGNEYQNGAVSFDLNVLATQYTYEADSFNNQYDADAEYPVISTGSVTMTGAATEALEIQSVGEIKSASVPAAAANTVFEAMKDDEAESNELTLTLNVTKTGEVTTTAGTTVALEIDMTAVMEKTKAGATTTTTEGVTTFSDFITIQYDLGAGLSNVTATHKGNAMVNSTNTAEDAGNGIYSYDSATGILTIKTTKLSPFAVSYVNDETAVYEAAALKTKLENGEKATLIADITIESQQYITIPAGKAATLDLNGYTLSVNAPEAKTGWVIKNSGTLVIEDTSDLQTGKITSNASSPDMYEMPAYAVNTVSNYGTFTLNGGVIENKADGYATFPVDNYSGATFTMNGGKLSNPNAYAYALRMFMNSTTQDDVVVINGGEISGGYGLWMQYPNGKANKGNLIINGGTIKANDGRAVYGGAPGSWTRDSSNVKVSITGGKVEGTGAWFGTDTAFSSFSVTGGTFADFGVGVAGGNGLISGGTFSSTTLFTQTRDENSPIVANGYEVVENVDGTYSVVAAE